MEEGEPCNYGQGGPQITDPFPTYQSLGTERKESSGSSSKLYSF